MNRLCSSLIVFIILISISRIIAQGKDCNTAIELCGNSPFHINPDSGEGLPDVGISSTCVMQEFTSMWIKWNVLEEGIITFNLIPDSVEQDIDFVVFQTENFEDCTNKNPIRCMASGANIGQPPEQWANCSGPTGLYIDETDTVEPPGCTPAQNNFLAPIEAFTGDQYVMLVNVFSDTASGYTLSFGGTAILDCITLSAHPDDIKPQSTFEVFPTFSTGTIFISMAVDKQSDTYLNIYNISGQMVYANDHLMGTILQVDLYHLPPGEYFVVLRSNNSSMTKKFLLAK
jgi:hypothetical protein